jgi:hypothetical protein
VAHLIRSIAGTNRDPEYGLWRNCELCAEIDPAETKLFDQVLAETPQELGMTLEEFWFAYSAELIVEALNPKD